MKVNCLTCGVELERIPCEVRKRVYGFHCGQSACRSAVFGLRNRKHGHSPAVGRSPELNAWIGMRERCGNSRRAEYRLYGARGITVCDRWRASFEAFLSDVGPCPGPGYSIDRIDNDGNYEPGNVRWATRREQCRNTRSNHRVTFNGETHCLTEWSEIVGLAPHVIKKRLKNGWTIEAAMTTPRLTAAEAASFGHLNRQRRQAGEMKVQPVRDQIVTKLDDEHTFSKY